MENFWTIYIDSSINHTIRFCVIVTSLCDPSQSPFLVLIAKPDRLTQIHHKPGNPQKRGLWSNRSKTACAWKKLRHAGAWTGLDFGPKFRKKPDVIEAYQTLVDIEVQTLEGLMKAPAGWWIITGAFGVVLSLMVLPDQVVCDIADAEIGGFNESEIILLPGRYCVAIDQLFVRQTGTTAWALTDEDLRLAEVIS